MPALSEDQIRTAFRMLNIPYSGPLVLVDNLSLNTTLIAAYSSTTSAQTTLRNWLTGVPVYGQTMSADSITKAGLIIDEYNCKRAIRGINATNLEVGTAVRGLNFSGDSLIAPLIGDLENLVPFLHSLRDLMNGSPGRVPTSCSVLC